VVLTYDLRQQTEFNKPDKLKYYDMAVRSRSGYHPPTDELTRRSSSTTVATHVIPAARCWARSRGPCVSRHSGKSMVRRQAFVWYDWAGRATIGARPILRIFFNAKFEPGNSLPT